MKSKNILRRIRFSGEGELWIGYSKDCKCSNCEKDYIYGITPMVKDELWSEICKNLNLKERSLLCKRCMEKGLGREIEITDTTKCPLNFGFAYMFDGDLNESKEERDILEYHERWKGKIERGD